MTLFNGAKEDEHNVFLTFKDGTESKMLYYHCKSSLFYLFFSLFRDCRSNLGIVYSVNVDMGMGHF